MGNKTTNEHPITIDGMFNEVIIDSVKYKLIPLKSPSEQPQEKESIKEKMATTRQSEVLDELFKVPVVKKKGGCQVFRLLRCISLQKFQVMMKEKEERKEKKKRKTINGSVKR